MITTIFNGLDWTIGEPAPINISTEKILQLNMILNHKIPLVLYFLPGSDYYEARVYDRKLNGIEILGAIKTYWDEVIPYSREDIINLYDYYNYKLEGGHHHNLIHKLRRMINGSQESVHRHELPMGDHIKFKGLKPYRDGFIVVYGN